jgi:hypothetical protein
MSKNEITRRAIARAFTALPIAAATAARASATVVASAALLNEQTVQLAPAAAQAAAGEANPLQKAHDQVRQTSEKLRAIDVAMDVEPAFTFRA